MARSASSDTDVSQESTSALAAPAPSSGSYPAGDPAKPDALDLAPPANPARAEEVHRALVQIVLDGGGLDEIAAGLVGPLGGAVLVTTPDGRVLAESGSAQALAAAHGSSCFEQSGRLRTETEPTGLTRHRGLAGNHVLVPVVAGRVDHGRIVAFSPSGALQQDDVTTLQSAATVVALALTKQLAVRAVESKYSGDFLREVITGRVDAEQAVSHAHTLGWDLDRPTVVLVAELDVPPADPDGEQAAAAPRSPIPRPALDRFAAAWQTVVRPHDERAATAGFHREVVAVIGVPEDGDVDRLVREVVGEVSGDGGGGRLPFSTGVSRVVADTSGLPAGYEQARIAMRVGRRMHGTRALAHFDGLGVFRLLSLVEDQAVLQAFADETLGALARDDDPEMVDLRRTLEVLLDTHLNVAQTARLLHFHYNTLRYRIAKLERMLGPFGTDPQLRLSLHMALQVIQMRGA